MIFSCSWNLNLHSLFPYVQERCFVPCCHTKGGKKMEKWMEELFNSFKITTEKASLVKSRLQKWLWEAGRGIIEIFLSFFLRLIFFSKATDQFGLFLKAFLPDSFKAIVLEESSVKSHLFRVFFVWFFPPPPLDVDE